MLTKNTDIIIDPQDPFKNDYLERKQQIIDLTNLIQSTKQPMVLSIEAPWGWGKTTFVRLWEAYLEQEKHPCLHFNAWSNDFAEDPLIAFLSEMNELLKKEQNEGKEQALKNALSKAQKIGGGILRKGLPVALRLATQGIIDEKTFKGVGDEIGELLEKVAEERIQAYEREKMGIKNFRESLAEFAELATKDEDRKGPVVFFVDELDRCRPDYAIALLERIKHLFNVKGVIFVLSIDRQQLASSAKAIYGEAMDADGYLRRFIDLSYRLPAPSTAQFCKMLFERFQISEFFSERYKDNGYRHDYNEENALLQAFTELAISFQFSLRIQEQCMTEINIVIRTTGARYQILPPLLAFLIAIKSYRPNIYQLLHQDNVRVDELISTIDELLVGTKYMEQTLEPWISAYIISKYCTEGKSCKILEELRTLAESSGNEREQKPEKQRAIRIMGFLRPDSFFDKSYALTHIMSRLDNIGNFLK